MMDIIRNGEKIEIKCTAVELAEILQDLWGHSMGMGKSGRELTNKSREIGVMIGLVNQEK